MLIKGNLIVIGSPEEATPKKCEYCGELAELRPYGRGGAFICYECGMKPENKSTTDLMFENLLYATSRFNPNNN
jgi:hypothetical protein